MQQQRLRIPSVAQQCLKNLTPGNVLNIPQHDIKQKESWEIQVEGFLIGSVT